MASDRGVCWHQRMLRRQGDAAMMVSQDAQRSLPLAQHAFNHEPPKSATLCGDSVRERFPEISVGKIVNFRMF